MPKCTFCLNKNNIQKNKLPKIGHLKSLKQNYSILILTPLVVKNALTSMLARSKKKYKQLKTRWEFAHKDDYKKSAIAVIPRDLQ